VQWSITDLTDVKHAGTWRQPRRLVPKCRVGFILGGSAIWNINGTPYPLKTGDAIILKPGSIRSACALEEFQIVAVGFEYLPSDAGGWPNWFSALPTKVSLDVVDIIGLVNLLRSAQAELEMKQHLAAELADTLIRQFFIRLSRSAHDTVVERPNPVTGTLIDKGTPAALARAIEHMHINLHQPLTVTRIAEVAGYSPAQFRRLFVRHIGVTPIKYLINARIERAIVLLKHRELTITQIAHAVGYKDPFTFSRKFKSVCGLAPSDFAAKYGVRGHVPATSGYVGPSPKWS